MTEKQDKINRRQFLKTAGAAGLVSVLAGSGCTEPNEPNAAEPNVPKSEPNVAQRPKLPQVPRRRLGKTGIKVPCLSLGAMFNVVDNQIGLRKSIDWGVTYWDTAHSYAGGNSELGIGKFLSKNTEVRKKLFIATKASGTKTIEDVENRLQASLKRMNTKYVDLYYGVHGLSNPDSLTDELKEWARSAKRRKLIRFFGFTTHSNMAKCLAAAAKLDWIDAIMTSYNFRLMQKPEMAAAVEACHKAGIGLVAMKTQGQGQKFETERDEELVRHFLQRGFTEGQAKIKIVLQDKRFSSACVGMKSVALLTSNVAAVLDKTKFTQTDIEVFNKYAEASCSGYCAGCAEICGSALPGGPYISEVMRYLMYYNSYGEKALAREHFARIPAEIKNKLATADYTLAEARCPQRLPIAKLVNEAVKKLA